MFFDTHLGHSRRSSFDFAQDERLLTAPCTKSAMQGSPAGGTCRLPSQ